MYFKFQKRDELTDCRFTFYYPRTKSPLPAYPFHIFYGLSKVLVFLCVR